MRLVLDSARVLSDGRLIVVQILVDAAQRPASVHLCRPVLKMALALGVLLVLLDRHADVLCQVDPDHVDSVA